MVKYIDKELVRISIFDRENKKMTEGEYNRIIRRNGLYEFTLYYNKKLYGYITKLEGQHYIVMPRVDNQNKSAKEVGTPVKLDQIESYKTIYPENRPTDPTQYVELTNLPSSKYKATKMIILGAGASYDYTFAEKIAKRPPLSQNIFDDDYLYILNKYPGAKALSNQFHNVNNLEEQFQKLWKRVEDYYHPELAEKLINTQFYIHELFNDITIKNRGSNKSNYSNLVQLADYYTKEHPEEYILFVNFNYDLLLEEALYNVLGYTYNSIEDYVDFNKRKLLLFKPHGSCNWVKQYKGQLDINTNSPISTTLQYFADFILRTHKSFAQLSDNLDDKIRVLNNQDPSPGLAYSRYYPWLLLPYRDKDEFVMPQNHVTLLTHLMEDINEIMVIGWKGTEDHFLKLLKNNLAIKQPKIVYANKGDKSIEDTFINKNKLFDDRNKWVEFSGGKFGGNTFSSMMDWFIQQPSLFKI